MNETEIAAAVAEQEEHIKRWKSCGGVVGRAHRYQEYRSDTTPALYQACENCGVSKSGADYAIMIGDDE